MTKRPFGHGDIRNMGNFKANAADYAYYLTLSDEGRLYCLTDRQVYALQVQLDYIGWMTRWYNTEDITQTTLQYLRADIEERLMSCVDVQILVDQANENLITTVTNRAIQSQVLRDVLEGRYDGTPTSINPSAPTTTWDYSGSDDGKQALCAALMAFVYQFARAQADSVRAGQVGGLVAVALIAALLIPGLNIFFVVGAAIAVLLGLGTIGVTTEVAIQALTDTAALDEVVCYMRDMLQGFSVDEATWSSCLASYPFASGSHAAIVADFLKATLATNYLTFLNIIGTGFDAVTDGETVPACPCDGPPPRYVIVNGLPTYFPDQTETFIDYDGDWDVWEVYSGSSPFAPFSTAGGTFNYGTNFRPISPICLDVESISGLNWQQSLTCPGGVENAAVLSGSYQQCGTYSAAPVMLRIRIKPS